MHKHCMEQGYKPCIFKKCKWSIEHFYTSSGRWVEAILNEFPLVLDKRDGRSWSVSSEIDAEPQEEVLAPLERLWEGLESACINMKQRLLGCIGTLLFPLSDNCRKSHLEVNPKFQHTCMNMSSLLLAGPLLLTGYCSVSLTWNSDSSVCSHGLEGLFPNLMLLLVLKRRGDEQFWRASCVWDSV